MSENNPILLVNAFSVNQLSELPVTVHIDRITVDEARNLVSRGVDSAVGYEPTAKIYTEILGVEVPHARRTVTLKPGDVALIGQYHGERLPEGTVTLPSGSSIEWCLVKIAKRSI